MKKLIITAMLLLSGSALADGMPQPDAPHLALLNGSVVQIAAGAGGTITITYVQPRIGLLPLVRPGSVLLVGQWRGDRLQATVHGSNPWCGFIPYAVTGSINGDGVLTLIGAAPVVDSHTCALLGWQWGTASTLAFVPWPL